MSRNSSELSDVIDYATHFNNFVPESSQIDTANNTPINVPDTSKRFYLQLIEGFYVDNRRLTLLVPKSGNRGIAKYGRQIVSSTFISWLGLPKIFKPYIVKRTENPDVFAITEGKLGFYSGKWGVYSESGQFENLLGFWSESTKRHVLLEKVTVFIVLREEEDLKIVVEFNYPNNTDIFNSLVKWDLESIDEKNSSKYFDPVSFLGVSRGGEVIINISLVKWDLESIDEKNSSKYFDPVSFLGVSRGGEVIINISLVKWDLESIDEKNSSKYFDPVSFLGVSRGGEVIINISLVKWDLESIDEKNSSKYFDPVSFLGVSRGGEVIINISLVKWDLESIDEKNSSKYFDPVSFLGVSRGGNHKYKFGKMGFGEY
ncbi:hypothetical protein ACFE04_031189 [Oxalis oulophora]